MKEKKVFVAMSGGVDSSATAVLLLKQGYDVSGVTMDIHGDKNVFHAAADVCETLNISHYTFDFSREFAALVKTPFANEYAAGRTPNPCVLCNRLVKWGLLLEKATDLGASLVATGHYVHKAEINGRLSLKRAGEKDQSYALYGLTQEQLAKTLFPLGGLEKKEVRKIAYDAGLSVHDKSESQDICFVNGSYSEFLESFTGKTETQGEFVLTNGNVVGIHKGISSYTIGQRKGLGISYAEPLFVQKIDVSTNRVILGADAELYSKEFYVKNVNYMGLSEDFVYNNEETRCTAKIRYAHKGASCSVNTVIAAENRLHCVFDTPQRAITQGQSAVFYDDDGVVLFGGVIE